MKTALDPRHVRRIKRMQLLFAYSFRKTQPRVAIAPIIAVLPKLDTAIQKAAPEWPIEKIAKIDLAVLRLAVWELAHEKREPPKVIIDEAVELAKSFGNDNSAKFINGVLGTIVKDL